jgi:hypothetical protein
LGASRRRVQAVLLDLQDRDDVRSSRRYGHYHDGQFMAGDD